MEELTRKLKKTRRRLWAVSAYAVLVTGLAGAAVVFFAVLEPDYLAKALSHNESDYLGSLAADVDESERRDFRQGLDRMRSALQRGNRADRMAAKEIYMNPLMYLGEIWEHDRRISRGELRVLLQMIASAEAAERERRR